MTATPDSFRLAYPAFADSAKWSDTTIEQALCEGDAETGGSGWGSFEDVCSNFKRRGQYAYAAHWLVVTYPAGDIDSGASASGGSVAQVSSKSVGDESITYAVSSALNSSGSLGDSWFMGTQWGQQFLRLRRRAGRGARAV